MADPTDATSTPTSRTSWAPLWVLAGALAMIVLDGTIVGVALPSIISDLRLDLADAQWVTSLYSVVFASLLLTAGRVADRFGRRTLLVTGVLVFVGGSILAAVASGAGPLIGARAVQGIGGAMVLPTTLSTLNATYRGTDRAAAFGVWGAVMSGAAAIGPLLGGWLTDVASWPWVFWVNVPIGLVVVAAALRWVPETKAPPEIQGVDLPGPVLSALGFGLLVFGLIEGNSLGWWQPEQPLRVLGITWGEQAPVSAVPVALVLGAVAVLAFVRWERHRARREQAALLDLRLFTVPTFVWGNLTAMLVAVGEFALVFVLPLFLVTSLGLSPLGAGLVLAAMAAGAFVSGAMARHLATAMGTERVVVLGVSLEIAGAAATALVIAGGAGAWWVAATLLPYGVGLGLAAAQLTSTVLRDVPPEQSGAGSATQSTVRQLGSALGSALAGTALAASLGTHAEGLQGADPAAFADAAAVAVWVAVGALAIGLLGAIRITRDPMVQETAAVRSRQAVE